MGTRFERRIVWALACDYVRAMARLPRGSLPEVAVYHVTARGVNGEAIYRDEADRTRFAQLQRRATRRWRWHVLASCQMTNHFHIVVLGELDDVSRGMHLLNFRYAQHFNQRYDRRGHLFQDRFDSRVVRNDEHLVRACEYVLDNAVRAGLCATREEWPWLGGELVDDLR